MLERIDMSMWFYALGFLLGLFFDQLNSWGGTVYAGAFAGLGLVIALIWSLRNDD
jgi:hypothetical protein